MEFGTTPSTRGVSMFKNYTERCHRSLLLIPWILISTSALPSQAYWGLDHPRGEAHYRVPIEVPPGTAGLTPELALHYSSGSNTGPAGWLGLGWGLEGGSRIERDLTFGVPYDYDDRSCGIGGSEICYRDDFRLDGQDLICAQSSCGTCAGTTPCRYRSQSDDGTLILFFGEEQGWEIRDRNGRIRTYGSQSVATIENGRNQEVFGWLLEREVDVSGNWVEYEYDHAASPGTAYLSRVRYAQAASPANREIVFELNEPLAEPRPDTPIRYTAGFRQEVDRRLVRVHVLADGELVTRYELAYQTETGAGRSLLAGIQKLGSDGQTAFPAHRFEYSVGPEGFESVSESSFASSGCLPTAPTITGPGETLIADLIDVNRDGLVDFYQSIPGSGAAEVLVNRGTGRSWEGPGMFCHQGQQWSSEDRVLLRTPGGDVSEALLDVDGDGFPDHISLMLDAEIRLGTSQGFAEPPIGWSLFQESPPMFGQTGAVPWGINTVLFGLIELYTVSRLTDMTGDGRPDLVMTRGLDPLSQYLYDPDGSSGGQCPNDWSACDPEWLAFPGWAVFPNLGLDEVGSRLEFATEPIQWSGVEPAPDGLVEHVFSLFYTDLALVDVNGDGLSDRLRSDSLQYGYGAGFEPPEAIPDLFYIRSHVGCTYSDLIDLNGDGLVDHVSSEAWSPQNPNWQVRYGNGTAFSATVTNFSTPSLGFRCIHGTNEGALAYPAVTRDLNGDGLPDHATGTVGGAAYQFHLSAGQRSGLLTRATNPNGGSVTFSYESALEQLDASGAPANPELWIPRFVVTRMTVSDGRTETPDIVDEMTYAGGVQDSLEREFRGFASVVRTQFENGLPATRVEEVYGTDRVCAFALVSRETSRAGVVYERTSRSYEDLSFGTGEDSESWTRCLLSEELRTAVEGDEAASRTERTVWDYGIDPGLSFFNLERLEEWGEWDPSTGDVPGDERFTEYAYAAHDQDPPYVVDRVSDFQVSDANGEIVRHTRTYYDGLPLGEVAAGMRHRLEDHLADQWSTPQVPGRWITTSRIHYDPFGNPARITGPGTSQDPNGLIATASYDPVYQTFLVESALGGDPATRLSTHYDYDSCANGHPAPQAMGLICQRIAPDGSAEIFGYDPLGMLVRVERASGMVETYEYDFVDPNGPAETRFGRTLQLASGDLEFARHVDGIGRLFRDESPGTLAEVVGIDRGYDSRGRLNLLSLPYTTGPVRNRSIEYDPLGRVSVVHEPDGSTQRIRTRTPWRVVEQVYFGGENSGNRQSRTERTRDGLGRLVRIADYEDPVSLSPGPYVITAEYDAADQLVAVSDPIASDSTLCESEQMGSQCTGQAHVLRTYWDTLGRRVRLEDPDAGEWEFEFDDAGLLKRRADGAGRIQNFEYDSLQRLVSRSFEPAGQGSETATFVYGSVPETPGFGRLSFVSSSVADYEYTYDSAGRLDQTRQATAGRVFENSLSYDDLGRVIARTFPDDEVFHFVFDGLRLAEIYGDSSNSAYSRAVLRNAEYDPAGRIRNFEVGEVASTGAPSAAFSYTTDPLSRRLSGIQVTPAATVADADGDRILDAVDNCAFQFNPDQSDVGSVVAYPAESGSPPDGIGDVCQCGDVSGDGEIELWSDPVKILSWRYFGSSAPAAPQKCNTDAYSDCDKGDYYPLMWSVFDGTQNFAQQTCLPAITDNVPESSPIDLQFEFDGLNRLEFLGGTLGGEALDRSFTYDGLGRLKTARGPWYAMRGVATPIDWVYRYDPLGNLRERSMAGVPDAIWSYEHVDKPRFLSAFEELHGDLEVLTAEPGGNVAARTVNGQASSGFAWNPQNRLLGHGQNTYEYDAFDRRVSSNLAGAQIVHVSGDFDYHAETGAANKLFSLAGLPIASLGTLYSAELTMGPGAPGHASLPLGVLAAPGLILFCFLSLAQLAIRQRVPRWVAIPGVAGMTLIYALQSGPIAFAATTDVGPGQAGIHVEPFIGLVADHLGSIRALVNENGTVVGMRDYDPFGNEIVQRGAFSSRQEFTSGVRDEDSGGVLHLGSREYQPRWGRFLTPDESYESFDSQGLNSYAFARNQPTSRIDPEGRFSITYYWLQPMTGHWSSGVRSDLAWKSGVARSEAGSSHQDNRSTAGEIARENAAIASELRDMGYDVDGVVLAEFLAETVGGAPSSGGGATGPSGVVPAEAAISSDTSSGLLRNVLRVVIDDYQSFVTGVSGNGVGIVGALGAALFSLLTLNSDAIRDAFEDIPLAAIPRYGMYSGPLWGLDMTTRAAPFDNVIDQSAFVHDQAYLQERSNPGSVDLSAADRALILGVWSGHRLGPIGQIYRIGLTILFSANIAIRETFHSGPFD
ncbi:MAG: hypothetical protein GY725_01685 [bacterium]|nr:hypothetical protein [bacterium]